MFDRLNRFRGARICIARQEEMGISRMTPSEGLVRWFAFSMVSSPSSQNQFRHSRLDTRSITKRSIVTSNRYEKASHCLWQPPDALAVLFLFACDTQHIIVRYCKHMIIMIMLIIVIILIVINISISKTTNRRQKGELEKKEVLEKRYLRDNWTINSAELSNKLTRSTCKQWGKICTQAHTNIPFCSFCFLSALKTPSVLLLSVACHRARGKGSIYEVAGETNISRYFSWFSFLAYWRICQTLKRRTRSVALYRKWSLWRRKSPLGFKSVGALTSHWLQVE